MTVRGNVLLTPASLTLPDEKTLEARLLLDTGSNLGVSLNSPFVRRHQLVERFPTNRATASVGINGVVASPLVALHSIALGASLIKAPSVALSRETAGLNASTSFDGILGADVLRHFRVVVDYPGRRLFLHPNPSR